MVSRQRSLPGEPAFTRQAPWSQLDRLVTVLAAALPAALLVDGLVFSVSSVVAWTGGLATAATATFLVLLWSLETRRIAVGSGWMALRARIAPSWIVVPAGDVVSVARRRLVRSGIAIRLRNGPPVLLRRGDLRNGVPEALREHLGVEIPRSLLIEDPADWASLAEAGATGGRWSRLRSSLPSAGAAGAARSPLATRRRPGLLAITRDPSLAPPARAGAAGQAAERPPRLERFGRPPAPSPGGAVVREGREHGPPAMAAGDGGRRRGQAWRWSALSVPSAAGASAAAQAQRGAPERDALAGGARQRGRGRDWRELLRRRARSAVRTWVQRWTAR